MWGDKHLSGYFLCKMENKKAKVSFPTKGDDCVPEGLVCLNELQRKINNAGEYFGDDSNLSNVLKTRITKKYRKASQY